MNSINGQGMGALIFYAQYSIKHLLTSFDCLILSLRIESKLIFCYSFQTTNE
jgi:hypothetical protein